MIIPASGWGPSAGAPANTSVNFTYVPRHTQNRSLIGFINSPESIQKDFTVDKPSWPLSSYGVAKNEPTFLSGLDVSPEELRVQAVLALKDNKIQDYVRQPSPPFPLPLTRIKDPKRNSSNPKCDR
jgi:hypothetical protein